MGHRLDSLKTERLNAGHGITRLAQLANVSDWMIEVLENGGVCARHEAQRIADALGVTLVTLGDAEQ